MLNAMGSHIESTFAHTFANDFKQDQGLGFALSRVYQLATDKPLQCVFDLNPKLISHKSELHACYGFKLIKD